MMPRKHGPVDRGLQIERTRMSWKRTLLSTFVLCAAGMRILPNVTEWWWLVVTAVAGSMVVGGAAYVRRRRRYEDWFVHCGTESGDRYGLSGFGLACFALSIAMCGIGCAIVIYAA